MLIYILSAACEARAVGRLAYINNTNIKKGKNYA